MTINLGHALLLAGHTQDAAEVFSRLRGRVIDGIPLTDSLRADFDVLSKVGVTRDLAEHVLSQLK